MSKDIEFQLTILKEEETEKEQEREKVLEEAWKMSVREKLNFQWRVFQHLYLDQLEVISIRLIM